MISLVEHVINAISNATFIVMEAIMFATISEAMFVFQCRQFLYWMRQDDGTLSLLFGAVYFISLGIYRYTIDLYWF